MSNAPSNTAQLEIVTAGEPSHRPALLFVHGAFCGGWVWSEHYLPFFAERGWRCLAVSLRGHGGSAGRDQLDRFGLDDYVADVATAAAGLDHSPVVIGHSMGGVVAQRFALKHGASGLALLAPASLAGLSGSIMHMSLSRPNLLRALSRVQSRRMEAADYEEIRRGLFSANLPLDLAVRFSRLFQRESFRANLELMVPQWFHLIGRPRLPVLVLGGVNDCFVPPMELKLSSFYWNAEIHVLDDVPHAMMLDTSWARTAETIVDWLGRSFDRS